MKDPRLVAAESSKSAPVDPRKVRSESRTSSTESRKTEKISIYEQGGLSLPTGSGDGLDLDLRNVTKDLDLRAGKHPF